MKTDKKQLMYESPEMEAIEVRMENNIASTCDSFNCGAYSEDVCDDCNRD